jgi:hypothetical protein
LLFTFICAVSFPVEFLFADGNSTSLNNSIRLPNCFTVEPFEMRCKQRYLFIANIAPYSK